MGDGGAGEGGWLFVYPMYNHIRLRLEIRFLFYFYYFFFLFYFFFFSVAIGLVCGSFTLPSLELLPGSILYSVLGALLFFLLTSFLHSAYLHLA